ncbi:craniofacial development protein 2-like [Branchiostoma lanceolatum]|uniref:craniofacial development protein 2-like n=1 Tax=Branchiostoma lanceolatum TaxID=7740 RepID=UPI003454373D
MRLATGELLLCSGHTEEGAIHSEGVALMLAREAQRALIGWEPVNPRIITAKFATKKSNINLRVIQCYAPTNDAEEEKKEEFYQQLQAVLDKGRNKDITLLMGDLNAKIGSDITGHEEVMGTHGLGRMNENAERFTDLCSLNQLVIGGSIFMHKRIHKATWRSPDHITENQIDHMCISQKFRRLWSDVWVMRGADVSSDHHLLVTSARLRLKKHPTTTNPLCPTRLQELFKEEDTGIEDQWQQVKKGWLDTCEEVLGKKKTHEKEWISFSTLRKLDTRKQKKAVLNKEVKKSIKRNKRDHIEDLAKQAEEAAGKGNLKDLYITTRKLAGKFPQVDKPVRDREGNLLTTTEEQLKRWAEHLSDLLNRPVPEIPPNIPHAEEELPINTGKPSKIEIKKAIMSLRNGKSAGPDDIPAEALDADLGNSVIMLHSLFSRIWEEEQVPAEWKQGILVKLPKKGDLSNCSNYRGIVLLSTTGKVFNRILLERMRDAVDVKLRDEQAGFRKSRSCAHSRETSNGVP